VAEHDVAVPAVVGGEDRICITVTIEVSCGAGGLAQLVVVSVPCHFEAQVGSQSQADGEAAPGALTKDRVAGPIISGHIGGQLGTQDKIDTVAIHVTYDLLGGVQPVVCRAAGDAEAVAGGDSVE
jgi:hypothetical protein